MDDVERKSTEACSSQLSSDMLYEQIKQELHLKKVLTVGDIEQLEHKHYGTASLNMALVHVLQRKDGGWKHFLDALSACGQSYLAMELRKTCESLRSSSVQLTGAEVAGQQKAEIADPISCVDRLRRQLADEYVKNALSREKVFQAFDSAKFSDITYITLKMMQQERVGGASQNDTLSRGRSSLTEQLVLGNSQLLSYIYGKSVTLTPLIILGQPGQGKTTFVQKLAYDWGMVHKGEAQNEALERISLLFAYPLRNLKTKTKNILDFVLEPELLRNFQAASIEAIKQWMGYNRAKTIVILDGYDELTTGSGCEELERVLSETIPRLFDFPVMITSRPYGLPMTCPSELRFQICELDAKQSRQLIQNHGKDYPPEIVSKLIDFALATENSFIRTSPLLLHLLCCAVLAPRAKMDEERPLRLPRSQTETYFAILEWLSQRRNEMRKEKSGKVPRFQHALDCLKSKFGVRLAEFAFKNSKLIYDQAKVVQFCGEEMTEEAKELGYLVSDAPFYGDFSSATSSSRDLKLSFPHKTFQEFFAAANIVNRLDKKSLDEDPEVRIPAFSHSHLEEQKQIILFAMGIAWAIDSARGKAYLKLVGKRIRFRIHRLTTDYRYNGEARAVFILSLIKDIFRETDDKGKTFLKEWAKENSKDFESLFAHSVPGMRTVWSRPEPAAKRFWLELVEILVLLGVCDSLFRKITLSSSTFVVSYTAWRAIASRDLAVCEVASPFESIRELEETTITNIDRPNITRFHFDGTARGFAEFLGSIDVLCRSALLCIWKRVPNEQTDTDFSSIGYTFFHRAAKWPENVISLSLSSHLIGSEVRTVFDAISHVLGETRKIDDIDFFDDFSDYSTAAPQESVSLEREALATISVHNIYLYRTPTVSAFDALLSSVREIDKISIKGNHILFLDELAKRQSGAATGNLRFTSRVGTINCLLFSEMLRASLAKFAATINATRIEIEFSNNPVKKERFAAFCAALANKEECVRERTPEELVLKNTSHRTIAAISDMLIDLLRSSQALRLMCNARCFKKLAEKLPPDLTGRVINMNLREPNVLLIPGGKGMKKKANPEESDLS